MNTTNNTAELSILKGDSIKQFAAMLLDNGMQVFTMIYSSSNNPSYIFYTDGQNIGYAQECESRCAVRISTVHKPCRECGTGYGLQMPYEGLVNPTIEDAKKAFILAPNWAKDSDIKAIRKYKGIEDFISIKTNSIGELVFLTK